MSQTALRIGLRRPGLKRVARIMCPRHASGQTWRPSRSLRYGRSALCCRARQETTKRRNATRRHACVTDQPCKAIPRMTPSRSTGRQPPSQIEVNARQSTKSVLICIPFLASMSTFRLADARAARLSRRQNLTSMCPALILSAPPPSQRVHDADRRHLALHLDRRTSE